MIRVVLPAHLRTLANVGMEVEVEVTGVATQRSLLNELEAQYPVLEGPSATRSLKSGVPSCDFSPVRTICHTSPRTPLCPTPS